MKNLILDYKIGFSLVFVILILIGCQADLNRHLSGDEKYSPEEIFNIVNQAIVKGDLQTAYRYLSSAQKKNLTLEEFKESYKVNKDIWLRQINGAKIDYVSIDKLEGKASARVIWGTGLTTIVSFVREEGIWREDMFFLIGNR